MNSITFLVSFVFVPLLVFLAVVIFVEERTKEAKENIEEETINMDDEIDWDDDE